MTLRRALIYFTREATLNLLRSWKISLLAILTITVSLFLGGVFLLVTSNLGRAVSRWQAESRLVIYLDPDSDEAARQRLREMLERAPWVEAQELITAAEARRRFVAAFPSLAELLDGWSDEPLPPSIEVRLDGRDAGSAAVGRWLESLRDEPAVAMIDDDRDWLAQLETVVLVLRALGVILGLVLLATAMFTIASVIRLTAYLYRDEIAVMRMVGATEFFIRGPFYVEGLLQGLTGGLLAVGGLAVAHALLLKRVEGTVIATLLARDFLPPGMLVALVALGGLAGLIGAVASLRREDLKRDDED